MAKVHTRRSHGKKAHRNTRPKRAKAVIESAPEPTPLSPIPFCVRTHQDAAEYVDALRAEGSKLVSQAPIPRDRAGRLPLQVEYALLTAPEVGAGRSLGTLIASVVGPGMIDNAGGHPDDTETLEGAYLRLLSKELEALAEGVDQHMANDVELPNMLRQLAERTDAARELAHRLRVARELSPPTAPVAGSAVAS